MSESLRSIRLPDGARRQRRQPASTTHTLRHSYAHSSAGRRCLAAPDSAVYLGHNTLDTTVIYTHLTAVSEARTQAALSKLYQNLKA